MGTPERRAAASATAPESPPPARSTRRTAPSSGPVAGASRASRGRGSRSSGSPARSGITGEPARYQITPRGIGRAYVPNHERVKEAFAWLDRLHGAPIESDPVTTRVSTGLDRLDRMLGGGLLPGTLTVAYGATGIGKTHLGLVFAHHGRRQDGAPGLLFDMNARG